MHRHPAVSDAQCLGVEVAHVVGVRPPCRLFPAEAAAAEMDGVGVTEVVAADRAGLVAYRDAAGNWDDATSVGTVESASVAGFVEVEQVLS